MPTDRELHESLRSEPVGSVSAAGMESILLRLQRSKDDVTFSLHASPKAFSMSGLQMTDLLAYLGFKRTECPLHYGRGYCRFVPENFDMEKFGKAVGSAFDSLRAAERNLRACGIELPQPEGWAHFTGKVSPRGAPLSNDTAGDGHTSAETRELNRSADDTFAYAFTWVNSGQDKGWTTHYHLLQPPLSIEVEAALHLVGLKEFASCPEFDFAPCRWRFTTYRGNGFDGNADTAHAQFNAHVENFSPGIEKLLAAHAALEPVGLRLLPMRQNQAQRIGDEITRHVSRPQGSEQPPGDRFDVAISFAGTDRPQAQRLADRIRDAGFAVFYDGMYGSKLWGKNLVDFFEEVYRTRARFCVIFVSHQYLEREWTIHERQSAQARALKERGKEYILPIKVDDVDLPGMPPTIGYLSLKEFDIDQIADILVEKLKG